MKQSLFRLSFLAAALTAGSWMFNISQAEEPVGAMDASDSLAAGEPPPAPNAEEAAAEKPKESVSTEEAAPRPRSKGDSRRVDRADAFLAGADWDFDGFVAGGQGSDIRSMFYLNDLIYLNIGSQQGVGMGDKIGIYKRGEKVNDPQTGKFIGYEVRRAAIGRVTDHIEDGTSAVRIRTTYEQVEIGDLVRREQ